MNDSNLNSNREKNEFINRLIHHAATFSCHLNSDQANQLFEYCQLLQKWNRSYNLTAIDTLEDMLSLHLLDCLAVIPHVPQNTQTILDIGSGAGLPGFPLAITHPHWHITSLDASRKKILFQKQAAAELKLVHLHPIHTRVEQFAQEQAKQNRSFDVIISRALASLADLVCWTEPLLQKQTLMLAMKGQFPQQEISELSSEYQVNVVPLTIPTLNQERHLVILSRK